MPILAQRLKEDIGKKSLLHAILFPKSLYTPKQAREWLKYHNLNPIHNRDTVNFRRFRVRDVIALWQFYTIKLNNGIELVYMYQPFI